MSENHASMSVPPLVSFVRDLARGMSSSDDAILCRVSESMRPDALKSRRIVL